MELMDLDVYVPPKRRAVRNQPPQEENRIIQFDEPKIVTQCSTINPYHMNETENALIQVFGHENIMMVEPNYYLIHSKIVLFVSRENRSVCEEEVTNLITGMVQEKIKIGVVLSIGGRVCFDGNEHFRKKVVLDVKQLVQYLNTHIYPPPNVSIAFDSDMKLHLRGAKTLTYGKQVEFFHEIKQAYYL